MFCIGGRDRLAISDYKQNVGDRWPISCPRGKTVLTDKVDCLICTGGSKQIRNPVDCVDKVYFVGISFKIKVFRHPGWKGHDTNLEIRRSNVELLSEYRHKFQLFIKMLQSFTSRWIEEKNNICWPQTAICIWRILVNVSINKSFLHLQCTHKKQKTSNI